MSIKYVKDFEFPSEFGFTKSASKGFAKGGSVHGDAKQDRKMVKAAVHKHEKAQHPGEPLTKLKKGGDVKPKAKAETATKKYTRTESGKGTKAVETGVEKKSKRESWEPPMTEAQERMLRDAAIEVEQENLRLERNFIRDNDYEDIPEDLRKKYNIKPPEYKRGGQVKQGGTGQQVRAQKGKGSYNREPLVGLKCGGKYKR